MENGGTGPDYSVFTDGDSMSERRTDSDGCTRTNGDSSPHHYARTDGYAPANDRIVIHRGSGIYDRELADLAAWIDDCPSHNDQALGEPNAGGDGGPWVHQGHQSERGRVTDSPLRHLCSPPVVADSNEVTLDLVRSDYIGY